MNSAFRALFGLSVSVACSVHASAEHAFHFDKYSCSEFLSDSKASEGDKLLKYLMVVSWATGYAAAHQKDSPRADENALQLIAATLGDVCRKTPNEKVVRALADTIQQFASVGSAEPAGSFTAKSVAEFSSYNSADIYGGDYQRTESLDLKACAASCLSDPRCKAYSYDKWNRICFLKERTSPLLLEPSSVTGVRSGAQIERSSSAIRTERRLNRAFAGQVYGTKTSPSFESCQKLCVDDKNCVTFSYRKSASQCRLYSAVEEYKVEPGVESGIKRQAP